jgi:hypothetical protein
MRMAEPAPQRQSEVATRGQNPMPFSQGATTHVFIETAQGGPQEVVAQQAHHLGIQAP